MDDISKQINAEGQKYTELPDIPPPVSKEQIEAMAEKIEKAKVEKKTTEKVSKNTSKKKEPLEDLEVADGKEKEDVSETPKTPDLGDLEYTDGKERDEIDLVEEQEKIYGTDLLSPFKTADVRVFRRRLETMSSEEMFRMAARNAIRTYADPKQQKAELERGFISWASTNVSFQTSATKKAEKGVRSEAFEGATSVKDLEEKLKSKTLSDLQATAGRLGFNPSFDRDKLITVIKQEYQRQS